MIVDLDGIEKGKEFGYFVKYQFPFTRRSCVTSISKRS